MNNENLGSNQLLHVTLRFLRPEDLYQVKKLCEDWFPIKYPRIWYKWITETDMFYALAALQGSTIIGLLVAQTKPLCDINFEDQNVLRHANLNGGNIGYILTLGVLKPYRRLNLASLLLNQYIEHVRLDYYIKCQNYSDSLPLADTEQQSQVSDSSEGSVEVLQEESSCAVNGTQSNAAHYLLKNSTLNEVDVNSSECSDKRRSPVTSARKSSSLSPSSTVQSLTGANRSKKNCSTSNCDNFQDVSVPSKVHYFDNTSIHNDSEESSILGSNLKRQVKLRNGTNKNEIESLRKSSPTQSSSQVETGSPVVLNINLEQMSSYQIIPEPSNIQGMTDARDVKISISGSSDSIHAEDKWNDHSLGTKARPKPITKSLINADINCNVLAQTNACDVPEWAVGRPETETPNHRTVRSGIVSNESIDQSSACGAGQSRQVRNDANDSSQTNLSNPRTTEQVPTISSSYIVESEVTRRDVLQRLKCFVNTDAPVTALLLHVLSSNSPAIAFYSRRKFMQLAFLPMFYTINDVAQDGYSYVFYLNGGESPGSFFADPFSLTRAGAVTFGTFGSFSYVRARVAGTVSRWMLGDFSLHLNVVGSMLASMIGILDKMVTTLMGADSR